MDATTWTLIVGIPLIIAVGAFLFFRRRTPRQLPIYYFRCPGCKRKLKYFARQAGHKGMCSNCKEPFIFPSDVASGRPSKSL
jgi:LPXTG-motif cell wall-anchored protein